MCGQRYGFISLCTHFAVLVFLALAPGCRDANQQTTGTVQGRITMDGIPIPQGSVVTFLMPEHGVAATGMTDEHGQFRITSPTTNGLPIGEYQVAIAPPKTDSASAEEVGNAMLDGTLGFGGGDREIPISLQNPATSDVTFTVQVGQNTFEYELSIGERAPSTIQ